MTLQDVEGFFNNLSDIVVRVRTYGTYAVVTTTIRIRFDGHSTTVRLLIKGQ